MKIIDNYEVKIWLGLRAGYTDSYTNRAEVSSAIKEWCVKKEASVSMTPTEFIYPHGWEPGLVIGFINYPRYPQSKAEIKNRAIELGTLLMKEFNQYRVSITFSPTVPGGTVMLENEEKEEK